MPGPVTDVTDRDVTDRDVAATRERVAARLVGRERELELVLSAVAAGRDIVLEGPPGTSKTTILRAITAEWGIPLLFVEGNADLTPAKLIGHHNPARVLREDYSADNFVEGPLVDAMRRGGFLYIEEINRAPEDTVNALLGAMADREVAVPRVGSFVAKPTFRVVASMNPYDNVGTTRLSTSIDDRFGRLALGYQDEAAEVGIVTLRTRPNGSAPSPPVRLRGRADRRGRGPSGPAPKVPRAGSTANVRGARGDLSAHALRGRLIPDAVAVTRATRSHPDIRQGSSVRGAIDCVLIALQLAGLRGVSESSDERYPALVLDAMTVALSGRIHLDEAAETTPEQVLHEIWQDHFVLNPAAAKPG